MRILVAAGFAPSLTGFRLPLLRALLAAGHEVHATAPEEDAAVRSRLLTLGVRYHPIALGRAALSPLADRAYATALAALVSRLGVEGFLAYTHKPIVLGLPAAAAGGARVRVAMVTGLGYAFTPGGGLRRSLARFVVRWLYRRALPKATHLFFQNPDDADDFRRLGLLKDAPKPGIVAGSGIPLEDFPVAPLPLGPPVFLMLGRLIADKGVREYAAAAAVVRQHFPAARCLLGGELDANPTSIRREELDGWVASGAIEYLGHLADVRPALRSATVYVLPSYREGTPRSVLEALATGRPVITTDAPGCRETMLNPAPTAARGLRRCANGWLVPVADGPVLAQAMLNLAAPTAPLAELAAASRRHAETKYDVRKVNTKLLAAFA